MDGALQGRGNGRRNHYRHAEIVGCALLEAECAGDIAANVFEPSAVPTNNRHGNGYRHRLDRLVTACRRVECDHFQPLLEDKSQRIESPMRSTMNMAKRCRDISR